jgi:hypothetical protein
MGRDTVSVIPENDIIRTAESIVRTYHKSVVAPLSDTKSDCLGCVNLDHTFKDLIIRTHRHPLHVCVFILMGNRWCNMCTTRTPEAHAGKYSDLRNCYMCSVDGHIHHCDQQSCSVQIDSGNDVGYVVCPISSLTWQAGYSIPWEMEYQMKAIDSRRVPPSVDVDAYCHEYKMVNADQTNLEKYSQSVFSNSTIVRVGTRYPFIFLLNHARRILWLLFFGSKRIQDDRKKLQKVSDGVCRFVVKSMKTSSRMHMPLVLSNVDRYVSERTHRIHIAARTRSQTDRTHFIDKHARRIVKLFSACVLASKKPKDVESLSFEYFTLAFLQRICGNGIRLDNAIVYDHDPVVAKMHPTCYTLSEFDARISLRTKTQTTLNRMLQSNTLCPSDVYFTRADWSRVVRM